jgi:uncharacterized protein YbbC (DUF1343 family)
LRKLNFIIILVLLLVNLLPVVLHAANVRTGAEVLRDSGFAPLQGEKYGLVTNQTATVGNLHLLDVLRAAGVPPAVIFVPEHGLHGSFEDGVKLSDTVENGILVRSLYGGEKKPRQEDLEDLDLLVFDIQDVGARFYTYISTLGLVMQGAAEAGVPLMVLDRPNPLGGLYVSGFVRSGIPATFTSFYPIPVAHGMTVGELAQMIQGEGLLPGLEDLELSVVEMSGWERRMRWPDTGLSWTPTSPNIADFPTALLYAGIGLLEGTAASEGRGTDTPFLLAGWPDIDNRRLAATLNGEGLPGVEFVSASFTPRSIKGRDSAPSYGDREVRGIGIKVTNYAALLPVETGVAVVSALYHTLSAEDQKEFFHHGIDDLSGSVLLRTSIEKGMTPAEIADLWRDEVMQFMKRRSLYLLYPEDRSDGQGALSSGDILDKFSQGENGDFP